ncbi:hypothetical protein MSAN_02328200 [Mycena sanguinolenta]|uniref:Uncharacterized protein n=1 Tax=Mycena sanguinolenta TaxID=230812 RepID=A0A8H6X7D0_9AGAR|nr:hypothetical protein MSAN_02328200 [Mycena sanguinolenta]
MIVLPHNLGRLASFVFVFVGGDDVRGSFRFGLRDEPLTTQTRASSSKEHYISSRFAPLVLLFISSLKSSPLIPGTLCTPTACLPSLSPTRWFWFCLSLALWYWFDLLTESRAALLVVNSTPPLWFWFPSFAGLFSSLCSLSLSSLNSPSPMLLVSAYAPISPRVLAHRFMRLDLSLYDTRCFLNVLEERVGSSVAAANANRKQHTQH